MTQAFVCISGEQLAAACLHEAGTASTQHSDCAGLSHLAREVEGKNTTYVGRLGHKAAVALSRKCIPRRAFPKITTELRSLLLFSMGRPRCTRLPLKQAQNQSHTSHRASGSSAQMIKLTQRYGTLEAHAMARQALWHICESRSFHSGTGCQHRSIPATITQGSA